jgi:Ca2+-binding RTX toxin-like protein
LTTSTVPTGTTDARALATSSLDRGANHNDGTLVHIGGGAYLTAGHVLYQYVNPGSVRNADSYTLHVAEGLTGAYDVTVGQPQFAETFTNFGWGTPDAPDAALALTADTTDVSIPMLVYADPNDAAGTLTSFGFPVAGGFDGETMVEVTGNLTTNSHTTVSTGNGDQTVLISDIGMQVYSGQSGSGVWITNDVDGDGVQETYLAGTVSLDIQYVGGLHATGFEPLGDYYALLGAQIEAAGIAATEFARATLVSGQSLGSSATSVTGTMLYEDLIGGVNADTLDGGGGRDSLFGGDGADVLIDGDGRDYMEGGAGADTFRLSADLRPDRIEDFQVDTDRMDISGWGVTGHGDLTITDHHSGRVIVTFGRETIVVDDGARGLTAAALTADQFIFDTSGSLPVVEGTAGNDKLVGSALAEELRDLGGTDNLFGRGGADLFVLSADGVVDSIKDFDQGADRMDISAWGATGLGELTLSDTGNGKIRIVYLDETLMMNDAGRLLRAADLTDSDFIFA